MVKQTNEEKRKAALAEWEKNKYYNIKSLKSGKGKTSKSKDDKADKDDKVEDE